jgi:hypothetical protein
LHQLPSFSEHVVQDLDVAHVVYAREADLAAHLATHHATSLQVWQ